MHAGQLIKELILNFGVMVTLIYLTSATVSRLPAADPRTRAVAMTAMAVVAGWVTMVLAVRIGQLTFDLRFLPAVLVAFYTRRPWLIAVVVALIAPARFVHGFTGPALYGVLVMLFIGIVMAAVNPWVSRKPWSDYVKIVLYVSVAVGINMLWMFFQHRFLSVNFSGIHITAIIPIQFAATFALCFVATLIFRDLENERSKRASLADQAFRDSLTGLHNRRHLSRYLDLLEERGEPSISVAYVDIDYFKRINDRYGHASGDIVLKEIGDRIAAQVRPADYCARLGGEEFVVVLPDCSTEQAIEIAERIRSAISNADFPAVDTSLRVTVSIGVATGERAASNLIDRADEALYRAKTDGRNRVVHAVAIGSASDHDRHQHRRGR